MLLSCYGRLRQADKVWAVYQRVLAVRSGGGQGPGQRKVSDLLPLGTRAAALQQQQQEVEQQALEALQRKRLEAEAAEESAARLVAELRLDALPLDLYGYSAVITSLSRVGVKGGRRQEGGGRSLLGCCGACACVSRWLPYS